MSITPWSGEGRDTRRRLGERHGPLWRQALLLAALLAGAGWAMEATGAAEGTAAVARAGADLTRLLRFMALAKGAMALGAAALVGWRLALPAAPGRMLAVTAAAGAMAAGPVLIWGMVHVGLGTLLLHGGLAGTLAALWGDPAVLAWLDGRVAARRRAVSVGGPSERRAPRPCRFRPAR